MEREKHAIRASEVAAAPRGRIAGNAGTVDEEDLERVSTFTQEQIAAGEVAVEVAPRVERGDGGADGVDRPPPCGGSSFS